MEADLAFVLENSFLLHPLFHEPISNNPNEKCTKHPYAQVPHHAISLIISNRRSYTCRAGPSISIVADSSSLMPMIHLVVVVVLPLYRVRHGTISIHKGETSRRANAPSHTHYAFCLLVGRRSNRVTRGPAMPTSSYGSLVAYRPDLRAENKFQDDSE